MFPVVAQAKGAAYGTSCIQQLRQIGIASEMYSADADDRIPYAVAPNTKFVATFTPTQERGPLFQAAINLPSIVTVLAPYSAPKPLWRCSLDRVEPLFLAENYVLPPVLQWKTTYFETIGASYDYDDVSAVLNGGQIASPHADAILFCDYPAVHGPIQAEGGGERNLLFADFHAKLDTHNMWGTRFLPPISGLWH